MENTPEAAGAAPAPQTEATPITNPEPAQAPDMHGFTSDQLADMRKFYDSMGGYEKVKSRISNPQKYQEETSYQQAQPTQQTYEQAYQQPQYQPQQQYTPPDGSITAQEFLAQQYFMSLAGEDKYSAIANDIASGNVLKEMASFNIQPLNRDGSINDVMVRRYLDLKAQTVPARATSAEPNASTAPTVEYVEVGDTISNINQAYEVISQDAKLRRQGMPGHPKVAMAEDFIKNQFAGGKK